MHKAQLIYGINSVKKTVNLRENPHGHENNIHTSIIMKILT